MDVSARRAAYAQRLDGARDLFTDLDVLVVWETDKPLVDRLTFLEAARVAASEA